MTACTNRGRTVSLRWAAGLALTAAWLSPALLTAQPAAQQPPTTGSPTTGSPPTSAPPAAAATSTTPAAAPSATAATSATPTPSATATAAAASPGPALPGLPGAVPSAPAAPPPTAGTTGTAGIAVAPPEDEGKSVSSAGLMRGLLILAVLVGPIFLANVLGKSLRMNDYFWRFYFVTLAILASAATLLLGWPPKLGIDLRGGVILVYQVKPDSTTTGGTVDMDKLVGTIKRRLDPSNVRELNVRPFGLDKVEIIVPDPQQGRSKSQAQTDQDELERIKRIIVTSGALEFRILASKHKYQNIIDRALKQDERERAKKGSSPSDDVTNETGGKIARWVPIKPGELGRYNSPEYTTREKLTADGLQQQVLVVVDKFNVTGDYLVSARKGLDEQGQFAVLFTFNGEGASRFFQLTSQHVPDPSRQVSYLGIVLDGVLQSAPRLNEAISNNGQISGSFTEQEVDELAQILTAGGLPAALDPKPLSEELVSPTLGSDTIAAGVNSMVAAVAVVVVFMIVYYRFAGIVANLALLLNVALTVAFMMMFNAAFTLAGLAGLALTVGMAVDANVLIYERMREELNRGATLRMAIRNGFDRASITIIDANLTTLITAVVLYLIGTDQVKGFAVALTVGLVFNLFTAITFSRLMFEMAERNRWVANLRFMQLMGGTKIDFIGKRYVCYAVSIALIGAGLIGTALRGSNLLNIDFTGGVSVTTVFEKPVEGGIAKVRSEVERVLPDATVQEVTMKDRPHDTAFKIVTSDDSRDHVEEQLKKLFGDKLVYNRAKRGALTLIADAGAAAGPNLGASELNPGPTSNVTGASPVGPSPSNVTPPAEPAVPAPAATAPAPKAPTSTAPTPNQGSSLAPVESFASVDDFGPSDCDQEPTPPKPAATPSPTAAASPSSTASPTGTAGPKPTAGPAVSSTPPAKPAATPTSTPAASAVSTAPPKPAASATVAAAAPSVSPMPTAKPTTALTPTTVPTATPTAAKPTASAAPSAMPAASAPPAPAPTPSPSARPTVAASPTAAPSPSVKPTATAAMTAAPAASTPAPTAPAPAARPTAAASAPSASGSPTAKPAASAVATAPAPQPSATAAAPATTGAMPELDLAGLGGDRFAGGTEVVLSFEPAISAVKLSETLVAAMKKEPNPTEYAYELTGPGFLPGSAESRSEWTLRLAVPPADVPAVLAKLDAELADSPLFPSSANVGAAVAAGAKQSAAIAMVVGLSLVLAYVWFRFQNVAFGVAAIVALVHDVLFTIGMLALSRWLAPVFGFALVEPFKIDLTIVAALLTIIGYSINDTIVIFDRIREVRGKSPGLSADLINLCVNQTLSRTILTSLTVFLVVVILYAFGGSGIHGFAFALVVGTISGTYSTIYVASPVLLWLHQRSHAGSTAGRLGSQGTTQPT